MWRVLCAEGMWRATARRAGSGRRSTCSSCRVCPATRSRTAPSSAPPSRAAGRVRSSPTGALNAPQRRYGRRFLRLLPPCSRRLRKRGKACLRQLPSQHMRDTGNPGVPVVLGGTTDRGCGMPSDGGRHNPRQGGPGGEGVLAGGGGNGHRMSSIAKAVCRRVHVAHDGVSILLPPRGVHQTECHIRPHWLTMLTVCAVSSGGI